MSFEEEMEVLLSTPPETKEKSRIISVEECIKMGPHDCDWFYTDDERECKICGFCVSRDTYKYLFYNDRLRDRNIWTRLYEAWKEKNAKVEMEENKQRAEKENWLGKCPKEHTISKVKSKFDDHEYYFCGNCKDNKESTFKWMSDYQLITAHANNSR